VLVGADDAGIERHVVVVDDALLQPKIFGRMRVLERSVLDSAPDILAARELLEKELRLSTRPQFLTGLVDRLKVGGFDGPSDTSNSMREKTMKYFASRFNCV
jgi:hypothetical protein